MAPRRLPAIGNCGYSRPPGAFEANSAYIPSVTIGRCKASLDVLPLCIRLVSADLRIPVRRRIGEELTLPAEGAHRFFIDFDAQAWPLRNGDVTLNHEVPFVA